MSLQMPSRLQTDLLFLAVLAALVGTLLWIVSYRPSEKIIRTDDTHLLPDSSVIVPKKTAQIRIDSSFWAQKLPWYAEAADRSWQYAQAQAARYRDSTRLAAQEISVSKDSGVVVWIDNGISSPLDTISTTNLLAHIADSLAAERKGGRGQRTTDPEETIVEDTNSNQGSNTGEIGLMQAFWVSFFGCFIVGGAFFAYSLRRFFRIRNIKQQQIKQEQPISAKREIKAKGKPNFAVEELDWSHCELSNFSAEMDPLSEYTQLKRLNLSHNQFEEFPMEVEDLQRLEVLDLSYNNLTELDVWAVEKLTALQKLDLSHNQIESIPNQVLQMPSLRVLILTGNPISQQTIKQYKKNYTKLDVHF